MKKNIKEIMLCTTKDITLIDLTQLQRDGFEAMINSDIIVAWR